MHPLTSVSVLATFIVTWSSWALTVTAVSTTTSPVLTSSSFVGGINSIGGEGFCSVQYLGSENGTEGMQHDVVGVATILELRRPQGQGCGAAVVGAELQTAAALLWAVKRLNGEGLASGAGPFIPGVRIDLRVYDDCSQSLLAARHIGELLSVHPDFNCTPSNPPLAGLLGTSTSHTTTQVASLLADTKIPLFGISATVSVLSDNTTYPTFFRTVPSDLTQSKVLVDLVLKLEWTYVAGIYTRDNYGIEGFQEFKRLASLAGVCIFEEKSFKYSDQNIEDSMEDFVRVLLIGFKQTRFNSLGVIFFGHDTEATILFQMIHERSSRWHDQDKLQRLHWLFSDGVGRASTVAHKAAPYTNKLISISPASRVMPDIHDFFLDALKTPQQFGHYWESLVTKRLQDLCQGTDPCNLLEKIEPYDYVSAALDSLYSLMALLSSAHQQACGGASGICQNLSQALDEGLLSLIHPPQVMNYSQFFSDERLPREFHGDRMLVQNEVGDFIRANSPLYYINSGASGHWTKIGEYCNGAINFTDGDLDTGERSECGTDCTKCKESDTIRYTYRPGDVILLGLYSISSPGSGTSFICGDYRGQSSAVAALMAFLHALDNLIPSTESGNDATGTKFGALVLDDCYSTLTVTALLADLFSGKTSLEDPASGRSINMSNVVAVVGSQSSSVTLSALNLLTPLHIPTISYSATSPDLDDRVSFPYFLRPVPSDSLQALALVQLVHLMNVTYVGFIHQDNNYGLRGMQQFVKKAEELGICVENPVAIDDGVSYAALLQTLRNIRNKDAMVVVAFVLEQTAVKILDAIERSGLGLIFLASEAWGVSTLTLQGQRGMTSRGSLVLTVDSTKEAGNIKMADYLQGLRTPSLAASDLPWMRDFWENEMACNLPGGFTNSYDSMCQSGARLRDKVASELAGNQKVVQTVNAVATVLTALSQRCQNTVDPPTCMLSLSAEEATLLIRNVTLHDQYKRPFRPYLNNSNGNVGFTLHNVQKNDVGDYSYVTIGTYDPELGLQVNKNNIIFYNLVGHPVTVSDISSTCEYKVQCNSVCGHGPKTTPEPPVTTVLPSAQEGDDAGLTAAFVILVILCGLLLASWVVLVFCARRRGKIPFLGVVKRDIGRVSRLNGRCASGPEEFNEGFCTTSARASLPLPPVPRPDGTRATNQYNIPGEFDRVTSISQSSATSGSVGASSPGFGFPDMQALAGDTGSQYDYSDDDRLQRRPRNHNFHPDLEHQDLWRQFQEQQFLQQLLQRQRLQQQQGVPASPCQASQATQHRPRARSVPRVDRPHFLPVRGKFRQSPNSPDAGAPNRSDMETPPAARPRSHSHDAAFRTRLGALSDDDQQLLLKYLSPARQQSQSPSLQGQRQQMSTAVPYLERIPTPTQNPQVAPSPVQSQTSVAEQTGTLSPNIAFANPPSFCSSRTVSMAASQKDDSSLLYLHAISSEQDMYLQVLPDPDSPPSASAAALPHENVETAPLPVSADSSSSQDLASATSPSKNLVTFTDPQNSVTSMVSPVTKQVRGSLASDSSSAVFLSPDREYPPPKYLTSPETYPPSSENIRTDIPSGLVTYSKTPSSPKINGGQAKSGRLTASEGKTLPRSPEQNRVLSSDQLQQLILKHNSKSPRSSASDQTTPQTSPRSISTTFPGVVSDSKGTLYLVHNFVMPLQSSVQPPHQAPGSIFPVSPPSCGDEISGQQNLSASTTSSSHSEASLAGSVQTDCSSDVSARQQTRNKAHQLSRPNSVSKNGAPQHISEQIIPSPSSFSANTSRSPRMGVDSLSPKRKSSGVAIPREGFRNPHKKDSTSTVSSGEGGDSPSLAVATTTSSPKLNNTPKTYTSDQPKTALDSRLTLKEEPGGLFIPPVSFGSVESIPYIQGYQLVPIPTPCGLIAVPQTAGSGASNHTSADSGNGEDLTADAENDVIAVNV